MLLATVHSKYLQPLPGFLLLSNSAGLTKTVVLGLCPWSLWPYGCVGTFACGVAALSFAW